MSSRAVKDRIIPPNTTRGNAARAAKSFVHRRVVVPLRERRADRQVRRLHAWARSRPRGLAIQIGSHNGSSGDPLCAIFDEQPGWKGVLVEPMPKNFDELTSRRSDRARFTLVRAAITDHDGTVVMYAPASADGPEWLSQVGSVDRGHVARHVANAGSSPADSDPVCRHEVPALTFASLLAQNGIEDFDLLHLDTEGHDGVILRQVDLARFRPAVVMFEHCHLSRADRRQCWQRLNDAGYRVSKSYMDTLAILRP